MSLLRFAGRVLFSAYFVQDGFKLLTKPDENADQLASAVGRVVPAVQSVLPPNVADRVPEDARSWTRILGATQIVGGIAYATGIARRPGAYLLTAASLPRLLAHQDADDRTGLFAQLALFGAGVVATQDTAGRPGLAWRAQQSRKAVEQRAAAAGKDLKHTGKQAEQKARKTAKKVQRKVKDVVN